MRKMLACVKRVSKIIVTRREGETHGESRVGAVWIQPGFELQLVQRATLDLESLTEPDV